MQRSSEDAPTSESAEPSTSTGAATGTSVIVKPSTSGNLQTIVVQEETPQEDSNVTGDTAETPSEPSCLTSLVGNMFLFFHAQEYFTIYVVLFENQTESLLDYIYE